MRSASTPPASPSRRRLIFTGVAGVAALALARFLQPDPAREAGGLRGLSPHGEEIMRALVPAFLDGALPAQAPERHAAVAATVDAISAAIAGLPPLTRDELSTLFAILAFAPLRIAVAGIDRAWPDVAIEDARAFIERLRTSRIPQKRAAYDAFHQLTLAAWYASPRAWPAIGYAGPPRLP
ncbi:MAG: hypothetical protein ACM3JC_05485 [Rudaea sp.]